MVWWRVLSCAAVVCAIVQDANVMRGGRELQGNGQTSNEVCPVECHCPRSYEVHCQASTGHSQLPILPNDTTFLSLNGYTIPKQSLINLTSLRHLKICDSHLGSLALLSSLPRLEELDISHSHLSTLGGGSHLGSTYPLLVHLSLQHNNITHINADDFSGLEMLQLLDLSYNPLSFLTSSALENLHSLIYLDISSSRAVEFPSQWMTDAPNLRHLNVSSSELTQFPSLTSGQLLSIDFSHNHITYLSDELIIHLPSLSTLLLDHNPIGHVGVNTLLGAKSLQKLDLSYINLTNVDEHVFAGSPMLKELCLDNNIGLVRIEHGAFTGLHKLEKLNLSNTRNLQEIEEVAFEGLINLQYLDIGNSGLTVLPKSVQKLENSTMVNLAGTSLHCDCYNFWLASWMSNSNNRILGINPLHCTDGQLRTPLEVSQHLALLQCQTPIPLTFQNEWIIVTAGQSALLECNVSGNPKNSVIWLSSTHNVYIHNATKKIWEWQSHQIREAMSAANRDPRIDVLASGHLLIRDVRRSDVGRYKCFAYNSAGNTTVVTFLGLSGASLYSLTVESFLFGWACAFLFLLITLIVQFINYLMDRLGWQCCCCKDRLSPKARAVRQLLETVETYKSQQLDRLKENYNQQVVGIKDGCYQQMEKLRESYSSQTKNLRDLRDYSKHQITGLQDQYVDQINKVRDYSTGQMSRVRENYVFQRHRIRKFSAHQLLKLRETYKYQQKTLNKILENLPDLYLQNCRTGACQRSDSIFFEDDEFPGMDSYFKVDFFDTQSHGSDYYTPASTLTRSHRLRDPYMHSRNSSNASCEFSEPRRDMTCVNIEYNGNQFKEVKPIRTHNRSQSMASPICKTEPAKVHKRSLSATLAAPEDECSTMPAKLSVREESSEYSLITPPTSPSSCANHREFNIPPENLQAINESITEINKATKSVSEIIAKANVSNSESKENSLLSVKVEGIESSDPCPFESKL